MELSIFIHQLLTTGTLSVPAGIGSITEADKIATILLLQQYYQEDILEMPGTAPEFNQPAAYWAAKYFFRAVQLAVLRNEGEDVINEKLIAFTETVDATSIYSADLILRYLPSLLQLAKGLSPADILVKRLEKTAATWPFSATGIESGLLSNEAIIFSNGSLRIAYIDRLIAAKDLNKITGTEMQEHLLSVTGLHLETFWPEAAIVLKNQT